MKIDLGNWGHGDRKGTGLFGQIEETLRDHPLRLNLSQQGKSQFAAAAPLLLTAFGYRHVEGNVWEKIEPEIKDGVLLELNAEPFVEQIDTLAKRLDAYVQELHTSMASMAEARQPQIDRGILDEDLAEVIARRLDKLEEHQALEPDTDLERHEERLLAIEADLTKLQNPEHSQLDALKAQVALLSAKVAELQPSKGRAKKE